MYAVMSPPSISDSHRVERLENPPAPLSNAIQLSHISDPFQHQRHRSLYLFLIDMLFTYLLQTLALCRHAKDQENSQEILCPCEQMRDKTLLILRGRHGNWPQQGRLDCQCTTAAVFWCHQLWKVQGFVDKWPVHHESSVVETSSQLGCDEVQVVLVADRNGSLIRRKQSLVRSPSRCVNVRKVKLVGILPLKWAR